MPIERINEELCNGCGACVRACTVDVIRMDPEKKKAVVMDLENSGSLTVEIANQHQLVTSATVQPSDRRY